uniref:Uncharacterized protein n=1 Tax=Arundo donax TaxID=35708 RepID=A0A0A8ZZR0_ARUDO
MGVRGQHINSMGGQTISNPITCSMVILNYNR